MFWIVDSILMRKRNNSQEPSVHYHKPEVKYNKLQAGDDSSDCEVTVAGRTTDSR